MNFRWNCLLNFSTTATVGALIQIKLGIFFWTFDFGHFLPSTNLIPRLIFMLESFSSFPFYLAKKVYQAYIHCECQFFTRSTISIVLWAQFRRHATRSCVRTERRIVNAGQQSLCWMHADLLWSFQCPSSLSPPLPSRNARNAYIYAGPPYKASPSMMETARRGSFSALTALQL